MIVSGWVASESRNQRVEHVDGGTVRDVLVRDGDAVAAGAVLLRFDDVLPRSEEAILEAQYAELVAQRNRLEAEFRSADTVVWDQELAALRSTDPEVAEILSGQERLFRARIDARTGEVAQLRERIGQARQEIAGLRARVVSLEQQSELVGEELTAKRRLFERGALDRAALLALERTAKNLQGLVGANAAAIARTRGRIAEHEIRMTHAEARCERRRAAPPGVRRAPSGPRTRRRDRPSGAESARSGRFRLRRLRSAVETAREARCDAPARRSWPPKYHPDRPGATWAQERGILARFRRYRPAAR